jgi:DNA helicase-2/ATP-dependent DNA helicase PcrA
MNDHGRDVDEVTDYLEQCLAALVSSKGKPVDPNGRRAKLEAKIRTARLADAYMQRETTATWPWTSPTRCDSPNASSTKCPPRLRPREHGGRSSSSTSSRTRRWLSSRLLRDLFALDRRDRCRRSPPGHLRVARCQRRQHGAVSPPISREVESLSLSTSWRNDRSILQVANRIAEGLADSSESPLSARDGAGDGQVGIEISSGAHDPDFLTNGLRALTEWFAHHPRRGVEGRAVPQTRAFRSRSRRPWRPRGSQSMCTVPPGC